MKPILSAFVCLKGTELQKEEALFLKKYNPVGLTLFKRNIKNPEQTKKLTADIRKTVGRNDFLIAIDQEGGLVRRLRPPYWREYVSQQQLASLPLKQAKEAIQLHARLIADDLHQLGINVVFAPVADTLHPQTTGAIASRCFSDNSKTVAKMAKLMTKTYLSCGICPCMKHLPGHGLASTDSHIGLPIIEAPQKDILKDLIPFQKMADFIPFGMTAHVILPRLDKKPITQSKKGINLIRKEIGFKGLLITDAIEMKALSGTLGEKVQLSLKAGCDVVCYCSGHDQNNPKMVQENIDVLKAATPLSKQSLKRLEKITTITQKPYLSKGIQKMEERYKVLTEPTKNIPLKGPEHLTENWGDRIK